jgi:hypothetical protein
VRGGTSAVGLRPRHASVRCPLPSGGGEVTLLRRAPREVYRVYEEAEFLAAADWVDEIDRAPSRGGVGGAQACGGPGAVRRGSARARAGAAVLCSAAGGLLLLSALALLTSSRRQPRGEERASASVLARSWGARRRALSVPPRPSGSMIKARGATQGMAARRMRRPGAIRREPMARGRRRAHARRALTAVTLARVVSSPVAGAASAAGAPNELAAASSRPAPAARGANADRPSTASAPAAVPTPSAEFGFER